MRWPSPACSSGAGGGGPVIGGQASAFHLDGWTIEEMLISRSVGMVVNWPSLQARSFDFATFSQRTRPYREVKEEQAKQTSEIARWISDARDYRAARAKGADRVDRNLKLEALAPYVAGEKPWLVRADRERDIRDAVAFFVDTHKQKIVLVGADEAWKVAALLAEKKVPVIVGPTQALPASDDDPYDATMAAPAVLHKAGVTFALSTYSSSDARNLPYEIGTAVGFGLPRDVALRAITLAPAQILGLDALVGSIEPGKLANLVVSRGDPARDPQRHHARVHQGRAGVAGDEAHAVVREVPQPPEACRRDTVGGLRRERRAHATHASSRATPPPRSGFRTVAVSFERDPGYDPLADASRVAAVRAPARCRHTLRRIDVHSVHVPDRRRPSYRARSAP